jgi:tight adherence protein C
MMRDPIFFVAACGAATALAVLGYLFFAVDLAPVVTTGTRGQQRELARKQGVFSSVEYLIRVIAYHLERLDLDLRPIETRLAHGGDYLGVSGREFMALRILSAVCGIVASSLIYSMTSSLLVSLFAQMIGLLTPEIQLGEAIKRRRKEISRALPTAIDLTAMCMGAGMDFPGAISQVARNMQNSRSAMKQELERILQELSLGRTRKQALLSFGRRVDTDAVTEFVNAVILAEEKGTPLSQVLAIQAESLRVRRSVMAEEAAARAGVMMMVPLMMMFGCIGLLLMGPLIIQMAEGGF